MQVIYRVVIKVGYLSATFDFIDPVAATKFADAAMINNVENEDGKARITIQLLSKEEVVNANGLGGIFRDVRTDNEQQNLS